MKTREPWALWFSVKHCGGRESLRQLPPEAISDCSGTGSADEAVAYWAQRLEFDGPPWLFREHLRSYGAWDASDLANHEANRARVLWIWACSCHEEPGACDFLYLGA